MAKYIPITQTLMKSTTMVLIAASLTLSAQVQTRASSTTTATTGVLGTTDTSKTWEFIGPNNTIISTPNSPLGIGGIAVAGRVNGITYDPLNVNILYAATANGGIWKSINKGAQWTCLSLANQYGYAFSCVTVDPTDDTTVYAGTGDYDGANNLGFGIIKFKFTSATATASTAYSIDTTFLNTSRTTFGKRCIRQITIDPTNHLHIFVAGGRDQSISALRQYSQFVKMPAPAPQPNYPDGGIWSTINGGVSWPDSFVTQLYFSNIVYAYNANPKAAPASQIIYASADFGGVFKSINNGNTWSYLNSLFDQLYFINPTKQSQVQPSSTWRVDVACSPVNTNTLYIMSEFNQAIYKSTDGGTTFTTISNSLPTADPAGNLTWGNASYDFHIACSKATVSSTGAAKQGGTTTTYDVVYAGLIDLFQSPQGVDSWQPTGYVNSGNDLMHPTQHRVAISPFNINEVSIANEGGVYKLVYSPTISNYSFTSLNATLGNMELLGGAFGFTDPTQALMVSQNSGNPHYDGKNADWSNPGPNPAWFAAINPEVAATQYVGTTFTYGGAGMNWTEDDWVDTFGFSGIPADDPANGGPPNFQAPVVMDLYNPDLLYVGQQDVWQGVHTPGMPSTGGNPPTIGTLTWTSQGVLLTNPDVNPVTDLTDGDTIVALAVSQFDNHWLYAGTRDGLFWFADDTSNWLRQDAWYEANAAGVIIEHHNNGIPSGAQVTTFATSTKKPKKLYAAFHYAPTFRKGVQQTPDIYELEVCNDVTAGHIDAAGVWVPTCSFSFISGTGATALPNVPINSVEVIPHDNDDIIVAGTNAGVYLTTNGGTTWTNISNDGVFPTGLEVTHVRYEPTTSYMYATTNGRGVWAKYIPNDATLGPLFKSTFQLYPTLQDYRGNRAKLGITVKFFGGGQPVNGAAPAGAPPIPQPYEYDVTSLAASGWWINNVSVNGAFDIWFKVTGFLSVRMKNTQVGSNTLVSPLVYAGDCNPIYGTNGQILSYGDNMIDINDLNAVLAHLGQIWTGPEDVDGDGVVTTRDLGIVEANQGMIGTP